MSQVNMLQYLSKTIFSLCILATVMLYLGCSKSETPRAVPAQTNTTAPEVNESSNVSQLEAPPKNSESQSHELPVITFGNDTPSTSSAHGEMKSGEKQNETLEADKRADVVIAALKDLQILLGTWRGITQKNFDGSKALDETNWVWDFKTNPKQPALVMSSEASPYYRLASMTYLPESEQYQLQLTGDEGQTSTLIGEFTSEIKDEPGDDDKPQRTYKLEFTEKEPEDKTKRLVFNQQNNNRYLLEVYEQRGGNDRFFRVDTVSTQREGTSMALIDEGYGERTCIISGGLGTITVSYQGKSYYVCCTGCKAAFEEEPERWIARFEEQSKSMN
ncbi:TRASH domain-containing protein [Rubinisphaera sp.]|mgnify:CR=1 FL=1|uniref:TRASH domain-containing protein n=1 Tax=Rubinisphaera sp. TaxID=2024857 RepID=UPI000C0E5467|nr:TRASH domain-containing protein [Rubinisphaera sp.]MBV09191.1 hypothetical protein [Rubinisphaera sp.]HCS53753.1 hypothetical protein [Planctomycetaceae bacterium]